MTVTKKRKKRPIKIISRLILAGIILVSVSIYYPSIKESFVHLSFFKIKEIYINTPPNIPQKKIEDLSGIKIGDPILEISINKASEKIKTQPWVKTVTIKRKFPNKLVINIESKEVLTLGKKDNKLYYIDANGEIICPIDMILNNQFMIINSYNGNFKKGTGIANAINAITTPGIYIKKEIISEIIVEGDNLFTLILSNITTRLHLNTNNIEKRLANIQKVIADLEIHNEVAKTIDATLENGKIVAKGITKLKNDM